MKDDSSVSNSKVGAHTPGPWTVRAGDEMIVGANGETVVYETNSNEADARLIAAAPELAEALIFMLECGICTESVMNKARAAIAKL